MSLKVLVIDDDVGITQLMAAILQRLEHHSMIINDPFEVVDLLSQQFDLIFLDLDMPGMDGIEVMRVLSEKEVVSSLVLMSGFDDAVLNTAHDLAEAHSLNVLTHLSKPFSLKEVQSVLKQVSGLERDESLPKSELPEVLLVEEDTLRSAMRERRIEVHYQPQMELKNHQLIGIEALCRLRDDQGELILPDRFIPLAEKLDIIHDLTRLVAEIVAEDCEKIFVDNPDMTVSINVTTQDLDYLDFPEYLSEVFKAHQIDLNRVIVEVTESMLIHELNLGLDVLARLRLKGFKVSIDDFGTGASTLEHIKHFPATELKIDKSFIQSLGQQDKSLVLVRHTMELAHQLGLDVVAEGVETEAVADWLLNMGCDIAQGYWLSRPIEKGELLAFLERNRPASKSDSVFSDDDHEISEPDLIKEIATEVGDAQSQSEVVLLSAILPKSGRFGFIGASQLYGIKAAFKEFDAEKTNSDFSIQLELFDDQSDVNRFLKIARTQLSSQSVACLGGVFTLGQTKEFIKAAESTKQPMVGAFSGSVLLRNSEWRSVFNVRPSYEDELTCIVDKLRSSSGKRVFVYPDSAFGMRALDIVEKHLNGVDSLNYSCDNRSHARLIEEVQKRGAEHVVFIGAAKTLIELLNGTQLPNTQFYTISLVGLGSLLQSAKTCMNRVNVTVPFEDYQGSGYAATQFRKYLTPLLAPEERKYMNSISFEGYINTKILLSALQRAQDNSAFGVSQALEKMVGVDIGLDCPVTWDSDKRQFLHQVKLLDGL